MDFFSEVKDEKVINKIINVIPQINQDKDTIIEKISPIDNEENEKKVKKCFNIIKLSLFN